MATPEDLMLLVNNVGRAFFARTVTLVAIGRELSELAGKEKALRPLGIVKDALDLAVQATISYQDNEPGQSSSKKVTEAFVRAEIELGDSFKTILNAGEKKRKEILQDMKEARERDIRGVEQLRKLKIGSQIHKPLELEVMVFDETTNLESSVKPKKYMGAEDDSLDGILFFYTARSQTLKVTELTYHPHFYVQNDDFKYELKNSWTPLKQANQKLYLIHNQQEQAFILLTKTKNSPQYTQQTTSVVQRSLEDRLDRDIPNSGRYHFERYDEPSSRIEEDFAQRWGDMPRTKVREFRGGWQFAHIEEIGDPGKVDGNITNGMQYPPNRPQEPDEDLVCCCGSCCGGCWCGSCYGWKCIIC